MLVQRWDEARLLWFAKGWSIDEVATEVQEQVAAGKRPQLADLELSESTVARRTRTNRSVPRGFGELVEELRTKPGRERETEVVDAGLRVLRGQPQRSAKEPQEIAKALLALFPAEAFAEKLAEAVLNRATAKDSLWVNRIGRRMARLLAKRLADTAGSGPLDALRATLDHADAKLDVIDAKLDRSRHEIARTLRAMMALLGIGALAAVGSCVAVVSQRSVPAAPVSSVPAPVPVQAVIVNVGPAAVVEAERRIVFAKNHHLGELTFDSDEMGEKAQPERWIPPQPLPYQKLPPCDARIGESAINGGCWANQGDVKPPCGLLFRSGDKCYRPIAADPQKPVGLHLDKQGDETR